MTAKELLEEGHDPVCLERAPSLGGVFRFGEEDGVVWESCRLTSSGLLTSFSDFPASPEHAGHMRAGEYVDYLERYCATFGVDRRLRFGTTVTAVRRAEDGWLVRTTSNDGSEREERYDAVAVCSGLHQHPHRPEIPGLETFSGQVLHSADYRRPADVAGRRVLVVGAGESGADVVAEVSEHAAETVVSLRRGVAVLPRTIRGRPNDYRTTRISNSSAPWVFETRNPADERKRNVYRISFFPLVLADKVVQVSAGLAGRLTASVTQTRTERATARLTRELLAESGGTLQEQFGTKSDEWVTALVTGRCRRAGAIARFDGQRAVFADGGSFEPEVVILCTGFDTEMPFLERGLATAPRFLHTIVPDAGGSLGFIGFVRPSFGAIPPLAELQARWFALLLGGEVKLPAAGEMEASIDGLCAFREHYFSAVRGRLEYLVDFTSFSDTLAAHIGCKPTRAALELESRDFRRRFFDGPFVAAQYRLVGPHAKPELARETISKLPVAYPRHELAAFHLRKTLSRTLHRVLGPEYAPKLELPQR